MNKYQVTYKQNGKTEAASVVAQNQVKARKAFSLKHPDIEHADIISVERGVASASAPGTSSARAAAPAYRSDYGAARGVASFISFVGWLAVIAGGFWVVAQLGSESSRSAMLLGFGLVTSGLLTIAAGQLTRATVDNADHTREILSLLKERQDQQSS